MTVDPRAALDRLLAALEAHYHAVATRRADDDPKVDDAYDVLADAFEVYDDAMVRVHGETLPFYLADDETDDEDDDSDDDEDDDEDDEDDTDVDLDPLDGVELEES
ncbi:MAG: DNA primase [Actinomycetales bacterium]|nr:DNA primase [Actinomycetales bacterium]